MNADWTDEWRRADPERYAWSLFFPAEARPMVWAVHVLAYELSRIPALVSEEMVGYIRLAWWREQLDALYAGKIPTGHPLLAPLADLIAQHVPPRLPFDAMIEARGEQVASAVIPDDVTFERFAVATAGMPALLALIPVERDAAALDAMRRIGALYGRVALWRSVRGQLPGRPLLPAARLDAFGIDPEQPGRDGASWRACVAEAVAGLAAEHRALAAEAMPPQARLLHGLSRRWLKRLARRDPLSPTFPERLPMPALGLARDALFTIS